MYTDAYIRRTDDCDDNLHRTMRRIHKSLEGLENQFTTILVTGLSGIIPGAIYTHEVGKQLVVIRKDDDLTHGVRTEGREHLGPHSRIVLLDDFISGGGTMRRLYDKLIEFRCPLPKYTCLYRGHWHPSVELEGRGCWIIGRTVNTRPHLYTPELSRDNYGSEPHDWNALLTEDSVT